MFVDLRWLAHELLQKARLTLPSRRLANMLEYVLGL